MLATWVYSLHTCDQNGASPSIGKRFFFFSFACLIFTLKPKIPCTGGKQLKTKSSMARQD